MGSTQNAARGMTSVADVLGNSHSADQRALARQEPVST
jgi:hypothetical protein